MPTIAKHIELDDAMVRSFSTAEYFTVLHARIFDKIFTEQLLGWITLCTFSSASVRRT